MHRRTLLTAAVVVVVVVAAATPLSARRQAAYPSKPIKLIVGFPPGGGIDFSARTIQAGLEAALGQPLVIEYKAGAGGVIAATELTRAAPDGYTLQVPYKGSAPAVTDRIGFTNGTFGSPSPERLLALLRGT